MAENFPNPSPEEIKNILQSANTIAVVGVSDKEDRPSYHVAAYLKEQLFFMIPVNPKLAEWCGEKCYSSLKDIHEKIDVVVIFRRSEDVLPVVEEAIAAEAGVIWMQEGIINEEAALKARQAGLKVVMDKCILKEHKKQSA